MSHTGENSKNAISRAAIIQALFETYESIYDIDMKTCAYQCYHESENYSELNIKSSGEDFFKSLVGYVKKVIHEEDQEFVLEKLQKDVLFPALEKEKFYSFVYRLMLDGKPVYHKIRATKELLDNRWHVFLGVRNVDETIRQDNMRKETIALMHQKEKNHLDAILASAWGYLEANLTKNAVLEKSSSIYEMTSFYKNKKAASFPTDFSRIQKWFCDTLVVENAEKYKTISNRNYLIKRFKNGEKRASVSFYAKTTLNNIQPYKTVFYLYEDSVSKDILTFSVIYDLTEQQRKEKELKDLERKLQISRISNFTSQMQPHFLYNALGSIQEVILDNPEYASELISDFTIHLRSCIRAMSNDSPIPFNDELSNIKSYVNIEKMRFGEKLKVKYEIGTSDFSIIPLSVQPLVENSIRHGIYERGVDGGTVIIRTKDTKNAWIVEVEDDGVGFDFEKFTSEVESGKRDSTGIKNITFRFDKVMNAKVDIKSVLNQGTKVTIKIPKGGKR